MHVGIVSWSNMPVLHVFCVSPHVIFVSPCISYLREDFIMLKFIYKVMYLHNFCAHIVNLLLLKLEQTWEQKKR
jgi:hypothetical protein